jgi:ArsR family transcriptional regulator
MTTRVPLYQSNDCCNVPVAIPSLEGTIRADLIAVFKALGDPTRFDVFRLIASQPEPICACDVVDRFEVSQPTIAHHLKVLREAGLVTVSRRGVWAYYGTDPDGLRLLASLGDVFAPERILTAGD